MLLEMLDLLTKIKKNVISDSAPTIIVDNINNDFNQFYDIILDCIGKDWSNLTLDMAEALGFIRWINDESLDRDIEDIKNNPSKMCFYYGNTVEDKLKSAEKVRYLYLIPYYMIPCVPKGVKLVSIDGSDFIYNGDVSTIDDERVGALGCGLIFSPETQ